MFSDFFIPRRCIHFSEDREKSEPATEAALTAPPKQLQLWFNEKIDVAVSKIELSSPAGTVALSPVHAMGEKSLMAGITGKMPDGTYTVAWQTAGDDGHVVKGDITFAVKTSH
jgi:methionine-rich copper-binding protein CopC